MAAGHFKKIKVIASISLFLSVLLSFNHAAAEKEDKGRILSKVHSLEVPFIENNGQIEDERVKFYAKTFGGTVFVTEEGQIVYSLPKSEDKGWAIEESFVEANVSDVRGEVLSTTKVSYFRGNEPSKWKSDISTYNIVSLGEIYEGIGLRLKAYGNNVEKLFHVKPGADPGSIRVKVKGGNGLMVNEKGELEVETGLWVVKFTKPVAYQEISGQRRYIDVAYNVRENKYTFRVGKYDKRKELIIDPLLASTFLGGSSTDVVDAFSIDSAGNVYLAGYTTSSDFPTVPGSYNTTFNGSAINLFVSKLDNNLENLLASTSIGGTVLARPGISPLNVANSISIDTSGNVYVTGYTSYSDFPTTASTYSSTHNGGDTDAFVMKFDNNLQNLIASTFLGGSVDDRAYSMSMDSGGNIYVTGMTSSADFPATTGVYDVTYNGGYDIFLSKFESNLQNLVASTFLGGSNSEIGDPPSEAAYSISLDNAENVYITGETYSTNFPTTIGAYDTTRNGRYDGFVAKLNNNLQNLLASTYFGGESTDMYNSAETRGASIALDNSGNVYVAGYTSASDFPATANAFDSTYNGGGDGILLKFDSNLQALISSTYLGGSIPRSGSGVAQDSVDSILMDSSGSVYLIGWTYSSDFPVTKGAYDTTAGGGGYVSKFDSNLQTLLVSTLVSTDLLRPNGHISIDSSGNVFVALSGHGDVLISKFDSSLSGISITMNAAPDPVTAGGNLTYTITYDNYMNVEATGALISDVLPYDTIFISATNNGTFDSNTRTVIWDISNIAANAKNQAVSLTVKVNTDMRLGASISNIYYKVESEQSAITWGEAVTTSVNLPPTVDAGGPYTCNEGQVLELSSSASTDVDGSIMSFEWDLDYNGEYNDATGMTATYVCADNGIFTIALTATDNNSGIANDTATITVLNVAPVINSGPNETVNKGDAISLDPSTFYDPGSEDWHTATVDWGDGVFEAGVVDQVNDKVFGSHIYNEIGIYTVTVTVTDDDGASGSDTLEVRVCIPGDVDASGNVDIGDIIKALRVALGVEDMPASSCPFDLDSSGTVNIIDVIKMLRIAGGFQN